LWNLIAASPRHLSPSARLLGAVPRLTERKLDTPEENLRLSE